MRNRRISCGAMNTFASSLSAWSALSFAASISSRNAASCSTIIVEVIFTRANFNFRAFLTPFHHGASKSSRLQLPHMHIDGRSLALFHAIALTRVVSPTSPRSAAARELSCASSSIKTGNLIFVRPPLDPKSALDDAILATGEATVLWLRENGVPEATDEVYSSCLCPSVIGLFIIDSSI